MNKIKLFFDFLYRELFKINDSSNKIAMGLGIGAASGIMPGTGPLVALFLALVFKVNRASALLGSLITNTWLSFVTFLLALKVGSAIFGVSWQVLKNDLGELFSDFSWGVLFKASFAKVIMPLLTGYLIVACIFGFIVYFISLFIIIKIKGEKK